MVRIAVLADIHANIPALEAVIEDIASQDVDEILVGGDLVGRGPQGSAVVKRLQALQWPSVRGNHEDYMLAFYHREVPQEWWTLQEWSAARWMAAELDEDDIQYIAALPFSLTSSLAPELHLFHGSPNANNEGIGPWTSSDKQRELFESIGESLLVCAHTHRPLLCEFPDGKIVNVGSVGLPFNGDARAQYAIFDIDVDTSQVHVDFRRIEYDREATLQTYRSTGFLEEGGCTSHLLMLELQHARPHLVPFIKWASQQECPADFDAMENFLAQYDPQQPHAIFQREEA